MCQHQQACNWQFTWHEGQAACKPLANTSAAAAWLTAPRNPPCSGRSIKSLKWFFILSCGLLLLIAAGLVAQGVVFFTSSGLFGTLFPYEV